MKKFFQAVIYYLLLPLIYLLSLLPFPLLYLLSDFLYFVLYRLMGYRKQIVLQNLRNSFPDKSEKEIEKICDGFYKHLCDLFLETFKTLTISRDTMLKHCYLHEDALLLFHRLASQNKSIIIVMGHKGNWEWAGNSFSMQCAHQLYVIYHPLENEYFDRLVYNMRCRFGTRLIAMKETVRDMIQFRNALNATAFIADQAPHPLGAHWMDFLNQDTPVFRGTEKIALKLKLPVVYVSVKKVKRGEYELQAEELEFPDKPTENLITEMHTRKLEEDIISEPETWLWSHRRWKHVRPQAIDQSAQLNSNT